jgi:hypothetical protein
LYEYLSKPDHVRVIIEGLGQVDHHIGGVLLFAGCAASAKGQRSGFGKGMAPGTTMGFPLWVL